MRRAYRALILALTLSTASHLQPAMAADDASVASLAQVYNDETDRDFRLGMQIRLSWTGDYDGPFTGTIDTASLRAIRYFQARHGMDASGVIDDRLLKQLVSESDSAQGASGYQIVDDRTTGIRFGLPTAFVRDAGASDAGRVWRSPDNRIEIEAVRLNEAGGSLSALYDILKKPGGERSVSSTSFSDASFSISGHEDGRQYSLRFVGRGSDLRGLVVSFDDSAAAQMAAYTTVALQLFDPFNADAPNALVADNHAPMTAASGHGTNGAGSDLAASLFDAKAPTQADDRPFGDNQDSSGSGFVVSRDGWVLTNAHVAGSCSQVLVGSYGPADSVILDKGNDLALVHVGAKLGKPLPLAAGMPRLGEDVLALGFPLRSILADSLNVTRGNVSSLMGLANDPRYLQISAPVQPGNSGGPLVDLSGRVVGVVTAKLDAVAIADATGDIPQSINFAIRPDTATKFLSDHGIAFTPAVASRHFGSVADTTAGVQDSVLPILCLGN